MYPTSWSDSHVVRILELATHIGDFRQTRKKMIMRLWDYLRIDYGGSDRSGMRYGCLGVAGDTRKRLLRRSQSPTMSPRTPNRRQCRSGTLELPKVKIHDFSSFAQSFGVFPGGPSHESRDASPRPSSATHRGHHGPLCCPRVSPATPRHP